MPPSCANSFIWALASLYHGRPSNTSSLSRGLRQVRSPSRLLKPSVQSPAGFFLFLWNLFCLSHTMTMATAFSPSRKTSALLSRLSSARSRRSVTATSAATVLPIRISAPAAVKWYRPFPRPLFLRYNAQKGSRLGAFPAICLCLRSTDRVPRRKKCRPAGIR